MKKILVTIAVMAYISNSDPIQADTIVEKCIKQALTHVLQGENITKYVDVGNIARTIAGPQWRGLTSLQQEEFTKVVFDVMTARILTKRSRYAGVEVSDILSKPSASYPGKLDISGKIGAYYFETIAEVSPEKCIFYTLNIEDMFRLSNWLGRQKAVLAKMKELGMKY